MSRLLRVLTWQGAITSDTFYFRLSNRRSAVSASVSVDGVNFQPPVTCGPLWFGDTLFMSAYALKSESPPRPEPPFKIYVDYIRFTPVGKGGGQ